MPAWVLAAALLAGTQNVAPTFTRDVAPILREHCAACHRPGQAAPFSLLTYADAKPRARAIATATRRGQMPPFLPAQRNHEFSNQRTLTAAQIDTIGRWVEAGAARGEGPELAPPPSAEGWQLGPPDLVVEAPEAVLLPPGSGDVFRNVVIPIPIALSRFVRGIELRPGNARVVHHASIAVDPTRASRALDAADPAPGFAGGMVSEGTRSPGSRALGWTPGMTPAFEPDGAAWPLQQGADLVVSLHMIAGASGVLERVRPSVALYFTGAPPTRHVLDVKLGVKTIDIRTGEAHHMVEDAFTLPVAGRVLSVYPHAHYLASSIEATATLPSGEQRVLLTIPRWNFHWQDEYRYTAPPALPAGTIVRMRYVYDNSLANPAHRGRPMRPVAYGPLSSDEMGDFWMRVETETAEAAAQLAQAYRQHEQRATTEAVERLVVAHPGDAARRNELASLYLAANRVPEAMTELEAARRAAPGYGLTYNNLGQALRANGRVAESVPQYREAARLLPTHAGVRLNLANALQELGEVDAAIAMFGEALGLDGTLAEAYNNRGIAFGTLGRLDEAIADFRRALVAQPENVDAAQNLKTALELRAAQGSNRLR